MIFFFAPAVDMGEAGFWSFGSDRIRSRMVICFMDRIRSSALTFESNQDQIESPLLEDLCKEKSLIICI